jgi:hypothetical protein
MVEDMSTSMSVPLLVAAAIALVTFFIHTLAGGKEVARPLLQSAELSRVPKLTMYYCWHIVTLLLLALAGALGYAAVFEPSNRPLLVLCLLLAGGCSLWNVALMLGTRSKLWQLPQWTLFAAIAAPIAWHLARG